MKITFFGHANFSAAPEMKERVLGLLEEKIADNDVEFYLGGYGNFDRFALECCQAYKHKHADARLVFITPYLGDWLDTRKEYLEKTYDEIIYPDIESTPKKFSISKRNEWMVNQADLVIGYVMLHFGGAYTALKYAKTRKKPYINLYEGEYELY